jgi:hypothetical protein
MSATRVEELFSKLLHSSPSISRRAASNLRQKLASNLLQLDDGVLLSKLAEAVAHSLKIAAAEQIDSSEVDVGMQESAAFETVALCSELTRSSGAAQTALIKAGCVEALAALQQQQYTSSSLCGAVERALQQLEATVDSCRLGQHQQSSTAAQDTCAALLEQQGSLALPAAAPTTAAVQAEGSSAAEYTHSGTDSTAMMTCLAWPGWTKELIAGSSLLTVDAAALRELLCSGWTLPAVKVSDTAVKK